MLDFHHVRKMGADAVQLLPRVEFARLGAAVMLLRALGFDPAAFARAHPEAWRPLIPAPALVQFIREHAPC